MINKPAEKSGKIREKCDHITNRNKATPKWNDKRHVAKENEGEGKRFQPRNGPY